MSQSRRIGASRLCKKNKSKARPQVERLEDRTLLSVGTGLRAEYFDDARLTNLTAVRVDAGIDFDWGTGQPAGVGLTSPETFAVRWSGQVEPAYSQTYTFTTTSDDGVRLWVDGQLIIDNWSNSVATRTGTVPLVAGRKVDLVMEYHEDRGSAHARLQWSSPSQTLQVVPQSRLSPAARGSILREYWIGIPGSQVADLTSSPAFAGVPSGAEELASFEAPANFGDNYGTRIRGYLHAPVTGVYELYIAADERAELWLSTDKDRANARRVALVSMPTGAREWDRAPEQRVVVSLVAGQAYFIEALHKEASQGDHLAVGWKQPGTSAVQVIPGNFLSPITPDVRVYVDRSASSELTEATSAFTIVRDDDLGRSLVVSYAMSGNATNGSDYVLLPGTVTISAGARTATVVVTPLNDTEIEATESVTLTLLTDTRYVVGTPSSRAGSATLTDDDNLPPGSTALFTTTPGGWIYTGAGGSRTVVSVAGMPFTQANRVVTTVRPPNPWDIRVYTLNLAPVTTGDTLLLTFWARNASAVAPSATVRVTYERASTPFTKSLNTNLTVTGSDWQRFDLAFRAAESYDAVSLQAQLYFGLGWDPQTMEIGGVSLLNFGPSVAPTDLTVSSQTYQGRTGGETAWRDSAQARIEQNRKANLTIQVRDAAGNPVPGAVVQVRLRENAFRFGSAVTANGINSTHSVDGPNYRALIPQMFNTAVLENDLKWPNWQSNPALAIGALDWLYANGIDTIRGHNLIWPNWQFMPASPGTTYGGISYRSDPNKPDSQEEYEAHVTVDGRVAADAWLRQRVHGHITEEASHPQVRGRLRDWDVVNEPFAHHVVQDLLGQTYGMDPRAFLVEWFQAARAADPTARLFLNDYPSLTGGAHLDSFFTTIQYLLANGAPLQGIGFQGHMGSNTPGMDALYAGMERFAAFGLPLQITEFDQESLDLQLQADFLRDFVTLAYSHAAMDSFLMWGFWQGRHWKPDAALWRTDWSIKPNGQQWADLVKAEWYTDVTGSTFADGQFRVRGYQGDYEVVVSVGGQTIVLTPQLAPGGTTVNVTIPSQSLRVAAFTPTATGFAARFNQPVDANLLNLYDTQTGSLGPADVTVTGTTTGIVAGSLVVSSDRREITFVRTGGVLPVDTYTIVFRSAANGFRDVSGGLLDGNADGSTGDPYTTQFSTSAPGATVGVPDFMRGPGQMIDLPAGTIGLPLRVTTVSGATSVSMTLRYDPALLTITGARTIEGGKVTLDAGTAGWTVVNFTSGATPLPAGTVDFVWLTARVPDNAPYTYKHLLDIAATIDGATAVDDDGVHVAAYFGDATGNAAYSSSDALRALRVAVGLDSGFAAFQLADPVIVADINGNGTVNSIDATRLMQEATGTDRPEIPALPGVLPPIVPGGPDPLLSIMTGLLGRPGDIVTVPVTLDISEGLESVDLAIAYDRSRLEILSIDDIRRGDLTSDFDLFFANHNAETGTLRVGLGRTAGPISGQGSGNVLEITFRIRRDAPSGKAVINLLEQLSPTITQLNEGGLVLNPAPSDEAGDVLDGLVTIPPTSAPRIERVVIKEGSSSQAQVTQIAVTFSTVVRFLADPADAFRLLGPRVAVRPTVVVSLDEKGARTVVHLTFTQLALRDNSLVDSRYTLAIDGDQITDDLGQAIDGEQDSAAVGAATEAFVRRNVAPVSF